MLDRPSLDDHLPSFEVYPPQRRNDYAIYPGTFQDPAALYWSAIGNYTSISKLLLSRLNRLQYIEGIAPILPGWELTHLSLDLIDEQTVENILEIMNFNKLVNLGLNNLNHQSLTLIYNKLKNFMESTNRVITVVCNKQTIDDAWKKSFDYLTEQTLQRLYTFSARAAAIEKELTDLKNKVKEQEEKNNQQQKTHEKTKADLTQKFQREKTRAVKAEAERDELIESKEWIEAERDELIESKKRVKTERDELSEKLKSDQESLRQVYLRSEVQANKIKDLQQSIVTYRDLRRKDAENRENDKILFEAIHAALLAKERAALESTSSGASSISQSDDDSQHTPTSPRFFLKLRKTGNPSKPYIYLGMDCRK